MRRGDGMDLLDKLRSIERRLSAYEPGAAIPGRTVIDRWRRTGAPANVTLLETLDADGFFALLAERLVRLR